MKESWTTHASRSAWPTFSMVPARSWRRSASRPTDQGSGRGGVRQVSHRARPAKIKPANISLLPYRSRLQKLHDEAEAFRNSAALVITEEHFVISKFFITLVSQAREIYTDCNTEANAWSKAILTPILNQLREHKLMLDKRLEKPEEDPEQPGHPGQPNRRLETTRDSCTNSRGAVRVMLERITSPYRYRLKGTSKNW